MQSTRPVTAKGARMFLKGKTAIVTGSTSGIGAACAKALAAEGANLMINGFGEPDAIAALLDELRAVSGGKAAHSNADLSDEAATLGLVDQCLADLGPPDILVNNAGIQHVCPVENFPIEMWRKMQAIMVDAPFLLMRACLPHMKARGWGRIVSTASAHASVASPNKSSYIAAKHAVLGLTRAVAMETAQAGITVNCISPGYVWTPLVENQIPDTMRTRNLSYDQVINDVLLAAIPQKKFVMPEQIGAMLVFLCRDEASAITGANLAVDGGWTTH
jgi:3-hydroxybutyrate dehydrogenase